MWQYTLLSLLLPARSVGFRTPRAAAAQPAAPACAVGLYMLLYWDSCAATFSAAALLLGQGAWLMVPGTLQAGHSRQYEQGTPLTATVLLIVSGVMLAARSSYCIFIEPTG